MTRAEIIARLQEVFDGVFLDPVQVTPELTAHDVDEWIDAIGGSGRRLQCWD